MRTRDNPLHRFVIMPSLLLVLFSISNFAHPAEGEGPTYLDGGVSVYGGNHFKDSPLVFVHGDTVQFNGWTDSHRDGKYSIADTSNATFTIDVIGPNKELVYHTTAITDKTGNAYSTMPIAEDLPFGTYEISYSLEKKGFVGISPHSEAPDVSYHESRFFVTWTQNDVIEASTSHELELIQSNSSEVQFGSVFELQGRLCPSPPQVSTHEVSYDDRTGAMVLDGPGSLIIVNHFSPIHSADVSAQERRLVEHNTTASFSENVCETPFAVSSQILWLSGKWQVTADAYWMQGNDTTHVYHAMTRNATAFSVAKSTYRSSNIVPIRLNPMKYPDTVPMDWSPDGKSILFSYQSKQDDGSAVPKLAVLSLDNMTVSTLETNFGLYPAKYSSDGSKLVLLIDSNLYTYDLGTNTTAKLTGSSDVLSFDVASDGRLLYTASANLVMTNSDGSNPKVVFYSDSEYETYAADIASDGSKVLFRKVISASYGGQDAVLAYYDLEEKKEHIVPNIHNGCGSPPKWAPNSFHIIFHESSCSRGWPGGILRITDQNDSFEEYIVPGSNDNPAYFLFSPDGNSMLIAFTYTGTSPTGGAVDRMGGPANFYLMSLARPVPELDSMSMLTVGIVTIIVGILVMHRSSPFSAK